MASVGATEPPEKAWCGAGAGDACRSCCEGLRGPVDGLPEGLA